MSAGDGGVTMFDAYGDPEAKVDVRQLPQLLGKGVRLVWDAGRRDFLLSTLLQAAGGVGIAALLLLGREAVTVVLAASRAELPLTAVAPWALALAAVAAAELFASAVQRERQQLLGEVVARHVNQRVLDVTATVELEAFDTPALHNRVQRVRQRSHEPLNLVFGLSGLISAVVGVVGVIVALIAIEPLLLPWRSCSCPPGSLPRAAARPSIGSSSG